MKPNINITDEHIKESALILNTLLADEYVLYTKTRNAHWNVQGPNFIELHTFFETQYDALDIIIDDVAERIRALGHFALGTLGDFKSLSRISEHNHDFTDAQNIIKTLMEDHEAVIRTLRKEIDTAGETLNDAGTADFLTGVMEQHEKMSWMLRAHLV
jgi:starvation-inducible DNA-binding protein